MPATPSTPCPDAGPAGGSPPTRLSPVLEQLRTHPELAPCITSWRTLPEQAPRMAPLPEDLDPALVEALATRGITSLYSHQRQAIDAVRAGRNVVLATPTASGKSLCYNLPVLDACRRSPGLRALYLFPTKALSADQVEELTGLIAASGGGLRAHTYDGDTPRSARAALRESGDIVVTNPYMLHAGILPHHTRWQSLFARLELVVLDELHTYRGVFGSHVANVLRRLRRLAAHHGAHPRFVAASATIANPKELAETLVEAPFELVDRDGSGQGRRHFLLHNPPVLHAEMGLRVPPVEEVRRLAPLLLRAGVQAIYFARSRSEVEVLTRYLKDLAAGESVDPARVCGYRGGYLPGLRRQIEAGLRDGEILAVAATSALELGVDIGSLDACVLVGYPGSLASTWQRAGRAGRRQGESLVLLVARSTALDQFLLRNPGYLFDTPVEEARLDPDNLIIRLGHLQCAAFELPLRAGEAFGPAADTEALLAHLVQDAGVLHRSGDRYAWMAEAYPAEGVSLQASGMDSFVLVDADEKRTLGQLDRPAVLTQLHPGAIHGVQGEQYVVETLDLENRRALLRRVDADYYTQAETETDVRITFEDETVPQAHYELGRGRVLVRVQATSFKKIRFYTRENLGTGEIHLPSEEWETEAFWIRPGEEVMERRGLLGAAGSSGLAAAGRVLAAVMPLYVRCDPADLGFHTQAQAQSAPHGRPMLLVFDTAPGGVGLSARGFECHRELLRAARDLITRCGCTQGCPACVGARFRPRDPAKPAAVRLLDALLEGEP